MKEQQAVVTSSIMQAMRSAAGTPVPTAHLDYQTQQANILQLLQQGQLNQAFQQVPLTHTHTVITRCSTVHIAASAAELYVPTVTQIHMHVHTQKVHQNILPIYCNYLTQSHLHTPLVHWLFCRHSLCLRFLMSGFVSEPALSGHQKTPFPYFFPSPLLQSLWLFVVIHVYVHRVQFLTHGLFD